MQVSLHLDRTFTRVVLGALSLACALMAVPAKADTYVLYNLGDDNGRNLVGITASGAVVTAHPCGAYGADTCYATYVDGVQVSDSATIPAYTYDDGTKCSAPSGFFAAGAGAVCNGDLTAFAVSGGADGTNGTYVGMASDLTHFGTPSDGGGDLNALGDYAFIDGRDEWFYEAVDVSTLPTPEPSSLLLLGSGVVSVIGIARRRFSRG